ncbi:MAG: hypothetical protein QGG42_16560 [Phycisphaerae bacterium]|nr:hypothetical protein [Phycisphaerae bacterium]
MQRNCHIGVIVILLLASTAAAAPVGEFTPPKDFHLVASDNCGSTDQKHVLVGANWTYPTNMVQAADEYRTIIFHNNACVLRYLGANPKASYKADVVYLDNGGRVQRLEANGREVHGDMKLPLRQPGRFLYDIPKAAYASGKALDLKFIRVAGANALVCYVRIWSTDKARLTGPAASERAKYKPARPKAKQKLPRNSILNSSDPIERDWIVQDRPTSVEQIDLCIKKHLQRGRKILADMRQLGAKNLSTFDKAFEHIDKARGALSAASDVRVDAWKKVYLASRRIARRLAFKNPLLHDNDGMLFVRRYHPTRNHQCSRRRSRYNRLGGEICILKNIDPDAPPKIISLTKGKFPEGVFSRPDISYDGKRMVFAFAPSTRTEPVKKLPKDYLNRAYYESLGNGTAFDVWEMSLSPGVNAPARRITTAKALRDESTDPIHLPSGRIAFMSPRAGGFVQCGDWAWADCMFTMKPDGSDVRRITLAKEGEWDPSVMDDGTIMFTRWEYVMRFWRPTQLIWSARPDGTNPRVVGGFLTGERNYAMCRQIPGTSKVVCVEAHHHNDGSGNILIVDLKYGRDSKEGHEILVKGSADCPYPLGRASDKLAEGKYFLVSYDPAGRGASDNRAAGEVAIYLADIHGTLELIHRDKAMSAMFPMPIRPRRKPPVIPDVAPAPGERSGVFSIQNVNIGLPESMHGKARWLQIVEAHERRIRTIPVNLWSGIGGFETKTVLGTVPIESDGSASFRAPAGKSVFFSVLDADHQGLHTMRMTTDIKAGERMGCVGCHEPPNTTPAKTGASLAARRKPSEITPPPWGVRTFGFPKLVQPILDKHCTSCHGARDAKNKDTGIAPDLRPGAEKTNAYAFVPNVYCIYAEGYKKCYKYQSYWSLLKYVKRADIYKYITPPGSWGSRVSPLTKSLTEAKHHKELKLTPAERRILWTWIDCNVPYLDDWRKYSVDSRVRKLAKAK